MCFIFGIFIYKTGMFNLSPALLCFQWNHTFFASNVYFERKVKVWQQTNGDESNISYLLNACNKCTDVWGILIHEGFGLTSWQQMVDSWTGRGSSFKHDVRSLTQAVCGLGGHVGVRDVVGVQTQMFETWIVQRSCELAETRQIELCG